MSSILTVGLVITSLILFSDSVANFGIDKIFEIISGVTLSNTLRFWFALAVISKSLFIPCTASSAILNGAFITFPATRSVALTSLVVFEMMLNGCLIELSTHEPIGRTIL